MNYFMPNLDIDPLYYHNKASRMIKRYQKDHQFYIMTGEGNGGKSIDHIKKTLKDPKLAPYDSDNDAAGN